MDPNNEKKMLKELRQIRNTLIVLAMKSGATSEELGVVTGMGASNVRGLFVGSKKKEKAASPEIEEGESCVS